MRESNSSYRRLIESQEHGVFMLEDMFTGSAVHLTCLNCGQTEAPLVERNGITDMNDKRKRLQSTPVFEMTKDFF